MKILLLYLPTPETFWSYKHVLHFVSKRSTFPPLFSSFKSLTFRLWDEQHRKLVGLREAKDRPPGAGRLVGRFFAKLFLSPGSVSGSRTGPRSSA